MKKFIQFVLLILTLIVITGCFAENDNIKNQPKPNVINQYSITSLDSLLFDRINKCKIVMISDPNHGHGYYMSIVTNFLNQWIDLLYSQPNNTSIPHKIALFLEDHSEVQDNICLRLRGLSIQKFDPNCSANLMERPKLQGL